MLITDFMNRLPDLDKFCRKIGNESEVAIFTGHAGEKPCARVYLHWDTFTNKKNIMHNISVLSYLLDILPEALTYRMGDDGEEHFAIVQLTIEFGKVA